MGTSRIKPRTPPGKSGTGIGDSWDQIWGACRENGDIPEHRDSPWGQGFGTGTSPGDRDWGEGLRTQFREAWTHLGSGNDHGDIPGDRDRSGPAAQRGSPGFPAPPGFSNFQLENPPFPPLLPAAPLAHPKPPFPAPAAPLEAIPSPGPEMGPCDTRGQPVTIPATAGSRLPAPVPVFRPKTGGKRRYPRLYPSFPEIPDNPCDWRELGRTEGCRGCPGFPNLWSPAGAGIPPLSQRLLQHLELRWN